MLTLDIAIVTRNRAQVLDLSLPLLLKQSRKPNAIIIVDSSDDPEATANVVAAHSAATDVPIMFIHSDAGISLQRNIALKQAVDKVQCRSAHPNMLRSKLIKAFRMWCTSHRTSTSSTGCQACQVRHRDVS